MINKIILIGRLTNVPESKQTTSGITKCTFSVATNEVYYKDGEKQEETTFHNIETWGKVADACMSYLTKGRQVYIDGKQINDFYEKDGVKKYYSKVKAHKVLFIGKNENIDVKKESIDEQYTPNNIGF